MSLNYKINPKMSKDMKLTESANYESKGGEILKNLKGDQKMLAIQTI